MESGIVGYQNVKIPAGFSMCTITFKNIDGSDYDLSQIRLCNSDGVEMDNTKDATPTMQCKGDVMLQRLDTKGGGLFPTEVFAYYTKKSVDGWSLDDGDSVIDEKKYTFKSGQGFYINNGLGEDAMLRFSGEVEILPVTLAIPANSYQIIGNLTPIKVDLTKIRLLNSDKVEMDNTKDATPTMQCKGDVMLQRLDTKGGGLFPTEVFAYYTKKSVDGWSLDDGDSVIDENKYIFDPGVAFYINNGLDETIHLSFPSPIAVK